MERGERARDRRLAHEEPIQGRPGDDRGFDVRVRPFHDRRADNDETAGHGNPIPRMNRRRPSTALRHSRSVKRV